MKKKMPLTLMTTCLLGVSLSTSSSYAMMSAKKSENKVRDEQVEENLEVSASSLKEEDVVIDFFKIDLDSRIDDLVGSIGAPVSGEITKEDKKIIVENIVLTADNVHLVDAVLNSVLSFNKKNKSGTGEKNVFKVMEEEQKYMIKILKEKRLAYRDRVRADKLAAEEREKTRAIQSVAEETKVVNDKKRVKTEDIISTDRCDTNEGLEAYYYSPGIGFDLREDYKKIFREKWGVQRIIKTAERVVENADGSFTYINPYMEIDGKRMPYSRKIDLDRLAHSLGHTDYSRHEEEKVGLLEGKKEVVTLDGEYVARPSKSKWRITQITCKNGSSDKIKEKVADCEKLAEYEKMRSRHESDEEMLQVLLRTDNVDFLGIFLSKVNDKSKAKLLFSAIDNGAINSVEYLLQNGFKVNEKLENGVTPFIRAAQKNDIAMMELVRKYHGTVSSDSAYYMLVADKGKDDDKLIEGLSYLNDIYDFREIGNSVKFTSFAVENRSPAVLQFMIDKGLPLGDNALYMSARRGRADIMKVLLGQEGHVSNIKKDSGYYNSSLISRVEEKKSDDADEMIRMLREKGFTKNKSELRQQVYNAIREGQVEILEEVADLEKYDMTDPELLEYAQKLDRGAVISYLLSTGSKISNKSKVVEAAIEASSFDVNLELMKVQDDYSQMSRKEVSATLDKVFNNPKMSAQEKAHLVTAMMEKGLSPSYVDYRRARVKGLEDVRRLFIAKGVPKDDLSTEEENQEYYNALSVGDIPTVMQKIQSEGMSLENFEEVDGSPMMVAVVHNHLELVRALKEAGADINATVGGKTPLDTALQRSQLSTIEVLMEQEATGNGKKFHPVQSVLNNPNLTEDDRIKLVRVLIEEHGVSMPEDAYSAARNQHQEKLQAHLLSLGAVKSLEHVEEDSDIFLAELAEDNVDAFRALVEDEILDVNINIIGKEGEKISLLTQSMVNAARSPKVFEYLLSVAAKNPEKVDLNAVTESGSNALLAAVVSRDFKKDIAFKIMKAGGKVASNYLGNTVLHMLGMNESLSEEDSIELAEVFLEAGADLFSVMKNDSLGDSTSYEVAKMYGKNKFARFLFSKGAIKDELTLEQEQEELAAAYVQKNMQEFRRLYRLEKADINIVNLEQRGTPEMIKEVWDTRYMLAPKAEEVRASVKNILARSGLLEEEKIGLMNWLEEEDASVLGDDAGSDIYSMAFNRGEQLIKKYLRNLGAVKSSSVLEEEKKQLLDSINKKSSQAVANFMIDNAIDVNTDLGAGNTPLTFAAVKGDAETLNYIIDNGANMGVTVLDHNPIHMVLLNERISAAEKYQIIEKLIIAGVDKYHRPKAPEGGSVMGNRAVGKTPKRLANEMGLSAVVNLLGQ